MVRWVNPELTKTCLRVNTYELWEVESMERLTLTEEIHVTITILYVVAFRKLIHLCALYSEVEISIPC